MTLILASARVETRRLIRSGALIGLLAVFAFFGLSGPALALYMPELLAAAAGTEQLTIEAADATPMDGIALFNQSAMQLGLILAVALAITSMSWDTRPGSSIFYRTRVRHLAPLMLPRLAAVADVAVRGSGVGRWETFRGRVAGMAEQWERLGVA